MNGHSDREVKTDSYLCGRNMMSNCGCQLLPSSVDMTAVSRTVPNNVIVAKARITVLVILPAKLTVGKIRPREIYSPARAGSVVLGVLQMRS
jgi:hypothetical protein